MKRKIFTVFMAFLMIFSANSFCEISDIWGRMLSASADVNASALDEALGKLDTLIDDDILEWNASLYDPEIGGFYTTLSAKNTQGYYPNLESTAQALGFLSAAGFSIKNDLPQNVAKKMDAWVKSLQEPDGYFYHPQWGKNITEGRRGRDLAWGIKLIEQYGDGRFLYNTPGTDESETGIQTFELPSYLQTREAFNEWLNNIWDTARNHYSAANTIQATKTAISSAGYMDDAVAFIISKQNPDTGLWDDTLDFDAVGACYKLTDFFTNGYQMQHADKMIFNLVKILTEKEATTIVDPYNAVNAILICYKSFGTNVPQQVQTVIDDNLISLINIIYDRYRVFRKADGGYSYYPDRSVDNAQGSPVSPGGAEGDLDSPGKVLSTRSALYTLAGKRASNPYTYEAYAKYLNTLETAAGEYDSDFGCSIVTDRQSNHLALASVYYTRCNGVEESKTAKIVPNSTVSIYADIINTYTLKCMTYYRKNRYGQDAGGTDAEFYLIMSVYDENGQLRNCKAEKINLPVYPGGGLNYRQRNVKIGSVDIPDITAPVLKSYIWRRNTAAESDSLYAVKEATYIKNSLSPEFAPLVLTAQSNDNEIKSIAICNEYGYVNNDRNKVKFIFAGAYDKTDVVPEICVAQGASYESTGTLADNNLCITVTAENGDKRTYGVTVEDAFVQAFSEDFSTSRPGDSTVDSLTLTDKGGETAFSVGAKREGSADLALFVSKRSKGSSGGIMVNPAVLSGTGNIKSSYFKFDINLKNATSVGNFSWYAGTEILGVMVPNKGANGIADASKFAFGTRFGSVGNEVGFAGNSVFTGTMDNWYTFAVLGSMKKQSYGNMPIGHTEHQYIEIYNIVDNVPQYLGEYFIFDRNKNKTDSANKAQGAISFCSYIDDLGGFNKKGNWWGFGVASSATVGEFALDNLLILRKQ